MAKYFLGSVGEATAFRMKNGAREFAFHATSITDQGINISSSQDEIRAGQGAPVVATFNHDTSVQVTLTDVFWDRKYLESKLGVSFNNAASNDYQNDTKTADNAGKITLTSEPVTASLPCIEGGAYLIWYSVEGTGNWHEYDGEIEDNKVLSGFKAGTTYCVRYLASDEKAREAWVTSDILPAELYLIIKTPVYAGDACAASNGNIAGHITFEIPRFKLDPNLDLSFAMSSNVTISLSGMAMGYTDSCNENGSKLMRIVENLDTNTWTSGLVAMYIDPEFLPDEDYTWTEGKALRYIPVYGVYENGAPAKLDNTKTGFTFAATTTGSAASTYTTITAELAVGEFKDNDSLKIGPITGANAHGLAVTLFADGEIEANPEKKGAIKSIAKVTA